MSPGELRTRVAAVRDEVRAVGELLAAEASAMSPDELFEVTGDLQGVLNAAQGAQLVAVAHAAAHETRLTDRGPVEVHHGLGFVDAMAPSEVSLATGVGQWASGRTVSLAAALAERFPRLLARVAAGELATGTVQKVVSACDGLDTGACAAVEAVLADRLPAMDPARVTTVTRRVASRVAPDQVEASGRRARSDRCVQVSPGPDGTTTWWARLPADRSAAAWAAVRDLADEYAGKDPSLTVDQARADALLDLVLTDVEVSARVTIGIPVLTGPDADVARDAAATTFAEGTDGPCAVGAVGGLGLGPAFSISSALAGCEVPGIGFIDPDTVEALLASVPLDVGRALLDARTGTLVETVSTAYRPPGPMADFVVTRDGTCRMWGCDRPAARCDLDHARPWPNGPTSPANLGGLCRRHHQLKQRRRWVYRLEPDGTATWTSPGGTTRTTRPDHAPWPRPEPAPQHPPDRPTTGLAASRVHVGAAADPPPF